MTPFIQRESVEWLRASVTATSDPTTGAVSFAFDTDDDPAAWVAGEWEGAAVQSGRNYTATARVLVGPGFAALPLGRVTVWIRAASSPEDVIKPVGTVRVA
jgi:hypothetical protein